MDQQPFPWYIVESNQRKGIRFTDIETGDRLMNAFGAAENPESAPQPGLELESGSVPEPEPVPAPAQPQSPPEPQSQTGDLTHSPLPE